MHTKHTFSLLTFIRKNKNAQLAEMPIFLRITVDGKPVEIAVKHQIEPSQWNKSKGRAKGNSEKARMINTAIETLENKARKCYNEMLEKGKLITSLAIKQSVLGIESQQHSLMHLFDGHVAEIKKRVNIDFASGTYQNYLSTAKHVRNYLEQAYSARDIYLRQLNFQFITGFELYLKTTCGNSQNGAVKHIQRVRKVVNLAIKSDFLEKDPFTRYQIKKTKTNRDFLSEEELSLIQSKDISIERIRVTRDVFLFACYTGLAYKDVKELTRDNIRKGIDGKWWVFTYRSKTQISSNIPLIPPALEIIERYKDHPLASNKRSLLPIYSNQRLNTYLKEIADICGISKNLSFHIARHTFATTITLSNDVPIETVSKMLGHGSLRTTQIYAKVVERKVSHDMDKLMKKFSNVSPEASTSVSEKETA